MRNRFPIIIIIILSSINMQDNILNSIMQMAESMDTKEHQILKRAKSHERAGLFKEAELIYEQLFLENPSNTQIFSSYKLFLYKQGKLEKLIHISNQYANSLGNNPYGKLALADSYLLLGEKEKAFRIFDVLFKDHSSDIKKIKRFISKLIYHREIEYAVGQIDNIRNKYSNPDFYSNNLGSYYLSKMSYEDSLNEYMLYLKYNPEKIDYIRKKLMSFPSDDDVKKIIKNILEKKNYSKINNVLLAEYEFKWNNYDQSCNLMINNYLSDKSLLEFGENMIMVNELDNAQKIFNHLTKSDNRATVETTIYQLAKILELKSEEYLFELPISNKIITNSFFEIPPLGRKKIDINSNSMINAIKMYDSLILIYNNHEAKFKLADLKSKSSSPHIDELIQEFSDLEKFAKINSTKFNSAVKVIDLKILNNEIDDKLINLIDGYQRKYKKENQRIKLNLKKNQVYFYLKEFDLLLENLNEIIKTLDRDNEYYNDFLDGATLLMLFHGKDDYLIDFSVALYSLKIGNDSDALEKFVELSESEDQVIKNISLYYTSYINIRLNNYNISKETIEKIDGEDIFSQLIKLLWAEVEDYVNGDINSAVDWYLDFLNNYDSSVFYEDIRLRLREISG